MSRLQLPDNWQDLSNQKLGHTILALFIGVQAEQLGIPANKISEEFAKEVIKYILTLEASSARLDSVEKALHLAAKGELEKAGERIRHHIVRSGFELKYIPIGINKSRQARDFGRSGAVANKKLGLSNREAVFQAANRIIAERNSRPSDRQMARDIAKGLPIKEETVRGHLRALRKEGKLG